VCYDAVWRHAAFFVADAAGLGVSGCIVLNFVVLWRDVLGGGWHMVDTPPFAA
jgi:hypothetical protein